MAEDTYAPEDDRPHVDDDVCGRCRKPILKGHRISVVHIVDRPSCDPNDLSRRGLLIMEEYEFAHADCKDPFLKKGLTE